MSKSVDPNKKIPQHEPPIGSPNLDPKKPVAHLTTPEGAIQVFKAEGQFSDKVALACFSGSNFGVFASSENGVGLFAEGAQLAAQFVGDTEITGNLRTTGNYICNGTLHTKGDITVDGDIQLSGQDYAEDFDVSDIESAEPGTVMVLDDSGGVRMSHLAYDKRVAGVVSGAGNYKPAVILGRLNDGQARRPLALMGKVFCRADASGEPIAVGDLLTTSFTPGHAMKATDQSRAFGAVIGKALAPLAGGCGLVPILVALQ